eukprot:206579-Prymnesium_polylepis.1
MAGMAQAGVPRPPPPPSQPAAPRPPLPRPLPPSPQHPSTHSSPHTAPPPPPPPQQSQHPPTARKSSRAEFRDRSSDGASSSHDHTRRPWSTLSVVTREEGTTTRDVDMADMDTLLNFDLGDTVQTKPAAPRERPAARSTGDGEQRPCTASSPSLSQPQLKLNAPLERDGCCNHDHVRTNEPATIELADLEGGLEAVHETFDAFDDDGSVVSEANEPGWLVVEDGTRVARLATGELRGEDAFVLWTVSDDGARIETGGQLLSQMEPYTILMLTDLLADGISFEGDDTVDPPSEQATAPPLGGPSTPPRRPEM